jgi:hypothetical protein
MISLKRYLEQIFVQVQVKHEMGDKEPRFRKILHNLGTFLLIFILYYNGLACRAHGTGTNIRLVTWNRNLNNLAVILSSVFSGLYHLIPEWPSLFLFTYSFSQILK